MTKKLLMVLIGITAVTCVHAQVIENFGKISPEEWQMKECTFDKDANAVILLQEAYSDYDDQHQLLTYYHTRIKILNEKGIDNADITIPYWSENDFEYVRDIEGFSTSPDENGQPQQSKLDKKSIYTKKRDEHMSEVRFTFPNVKPGTIVEYQYRSIMKSYAGLEDWYFQQELPVMQSTYRLTVLPSLEFTYQIRKSPEMDIDVKRSESDGRVTFTMGKIPGLRYEPYMDARRDYLQRVEFQLSGYGSSGFGKSRYMTSWDEVARELMANRGFGGQLKKKLSGTEAFMATVEQQSSPEEKMKMVYDYVRRSMTWNGYDSKYSDNVKDAWDKKSGTSGEINLILVNLLSQAGLDADPMLVSERQHGQVSTEYPFIDQFNMTYAFVQIGDNKYYLDASNSATPAYIIPMRVLNTTAFVVRKRNSELIKIDDTRFRYLDNINLISYIQPDGTLSGQVRISSLDYARVSRLAAYRQNQEQYIEDHFRKNVSGVQLDSFDLDEKQEPNRPMNESFKFQLPLNKSGEYTFVPLNIFSGFEKNPFIADHRFTNINFGYRQTINLNFLINIPDGYVVDAIPKSMQLVTPDKTIAFTRQLQYEPGMNKLVGRISISIGKGLFDASEYPLIQQFYKKMFDLLNEQLVLKSK